MSALGTGSGAGAWPGIGTAHGLGSHVAAPGPACAPATTGPARRSLTDAARVLVTQWATPRWSLGGTLPVGLSVGHCLLLTRPCHGVEPPLDTSLLMQFSRGGRKSQVPRVSLHSRTGEMQTRRA